MAQTVIGVDVAKDWIDARPRGGKSERIAMEEGALRRFAEQAAKEGARVVFEATGGYDRPLAAALAEAGVTHARVNPAQVRQFARATGVAAKTDRVDARVWPRWGRGSSWLRRRRCCRRGATSRRWRHVGGSSSACASRS